MMRGIFREAPTQPRYTSTWDPNVVLTFINRQSVEKLDLQQLTQRLTILMLLCSGQRCQPLAQLGASVAGGSEECIFRIKGLLKTPRPGHVQNRLVLKAFKENRNVCIVNYVQEYIR